jgi:hypothetical protein
MPRGFYFKLLPGNDPDEDRPHPDKQPALTGIFDHASHG